MKEQEMTDSARKRLAERLRRMLYWTKIDPGDPRINAVILEVITERLWRIWGYPRLLDCLLDVFKLPLQKAVEWTKAAVGRGDEDGDLYGNSTTQE